MKDVVYLREGFPPSRRLCRLSTANNVDRSFHVMDAGQGVFEIAASDPGIAEVTEGRMVEIEGYGSTSASLADNNEPVIAAVPLFAAGAIVYRAQGFMTPRSGSGTLTAISLSLAKILLPTGTLHLHLYSDAAGVPGTALATSTNTIACAALAVISAWHTFTFAPYALSPNTRYHWVIDPDNAVQDNANYVIVGIGGFSYSLSGSRAYSADKLNWTPLAADFRCRFACDWHRGIKAVAPWVGWIDRLGDADDKGIVTVDCIDAAAKLGERHSGLTTSRSGNADVIARELLYECNSRNGFGIIWDVSSETGTPVANIDLSGSSVLEALNKLADATGDEWWFEYVITPDQLKIMLHWGRQQGFDLSSRVCLRDRYSISRCDYSRDAIERADTVLVVGEGGSMDERPGMVRAVSQPERAGLSGIAVQGASQSLRLQTAPEPSLAAERIIVAPREGDMGVLAQMAERDLEAPLDASETLSLSINENIDWAALPVGSIVRMVHKTAWGTLDRRVRIMEMQPGVGTCDLEVKVLDG